MTNMININTNSKLPSAKEVLINELISQLLVSQANYSGIKDEVEEMEQHIGKCVDYLCALKSDSDAELLAQNSNVTKVDSKLIVKKELDLSGLRVNFGIAEAMILQTYEEDGKCMHNINIVDLIYDYKTVDSYNNLMGKVEAENNIRLISYAIGAMRTLRKENQIGENDNINTITITVYQPELGHNVNWTTNYNELKTWEARLTV